MKKLYLLTFLLLSSTAMAGDTNSSIWDPVDDGSGSSGLTINESTGEVSNWSALDGGEGKTAGDLEKAKTATRYQDTQWDENGTAATVEKSEETVNAANVADQKYDSATNAHNAADAAYSNLTNAKNAKDAAQTAYDNAVAQKEADCAVGSITYANCFNSISQVAQAQQALDDATKTYNTAQSASTAADDAFRQSVADLTAANTDVQKVMNTIKPEEAAKLRTQMSNIDMNQWDTYMADDTARQMVQNQFAQLHKDYDVPNYDLSTETGRDQAQKFVNSMNQTLQVRDQSDSLYYRLYMAKDDSGTDQKTLVEP